MTKLFTIGHSTRSLDEFIALLREFKIEVLVDIRRFPGSRRLPHFNRQDLEQTLPAAGIEYIWLEDLGGRRSASPRVGETSPNGGSGPDLANLSAVAESQNPGLRHPAFRHYADYMQTDQFQKAVERLISIASKKTAAIMCAEKLFWKCHRRLLSDYLVAHSILVEHIIETAKTQPHKLSPDAAITPDGHVVYPSNQLPFPP
ncbi:MAG: DUF488 domain-containing protein [Sedimentisphaerales bacterium]|jgi:uncharacterized protein (DUF488 family)